MLTTTTTTTTSNNSSNSKSLKSSDNSPVQSSIISGTRRITTTSFPNCERIEEFDTTTHDILIRKWRHQSSLGAWSSWEFEIGEPPRTNSSSAQLLEGGGGGRLVVSASNPTLVRLDTRTHFQWRIRNMPWPQDTYKVSIDQKERKVIVRTTNKKYFTRFSLPDLDRLSLPIDPSSISVEYANNTLLISYVKPNVLLAIEGKEREERMKMGASSGSSSSKKNAGGSSSEAPGPAVGAAAECNQQ